MSQRIINDKTLKMARAARSHHEPTSAELKLARHMAQDGKCFAEIHAALGWTCTLQNTYVRLHKFNIRSRVATRGHVAAKFGGVTGFGSPYALSDQRAYRPKVRSA